MGLERIEAGMLAVSRAGHDKDTLYVVWDVQDEYVWLVDGRLKPLDKPKKKKKKHIQIIYTIPENLQEKLLQKETIQNEDIKRAIKTYLKRPLKEGS